MKITRITATEENIDRVSLVSEAANGGNIMTCGVDFCGIDMENHIITAPVLIPLQKIYRAEPERFFYMTNEAVSNLGRRFLSNVNNNQLSTDHNYMLSSGLSLAESWMTKDILNDYPIGTWMMTLNVTDDTIWEGVLNGTYTGLSIEAMLKEETVLEITDETTTQDLENLPVDIQREIFSDFI